MLVELLQVHKDMGELLAALKEVALTDSLTIRERASAARWHNAIVSELKKR